MQNQKAVWERRTFECSCPFASRAKPIQFSSPKILHSAQHPFLLPSPYISARRIQFILLICTCVSPPSSTYFTCSCRAFLSFHPIRIIVIFSLFIIQWHIWTLFANTQKLEKQVSAGQAGASVDSESLSLLTNSMRWFWRMLLLLLCTALIGCLYLLRGAPYHARPFVELTRPPPRQEPTQASQKGAVARHIPAATCNLWKSKISVEGYAIIRRYVSLVGACL